MNNFVPLQTEQNNKGEIMQDEVKVPRRLNEFLQLQQSNNRTHTINSDGLYQHHLQSD